jgi:hypothetical protein
VAFSGACKKAAPAPSREEVAKALDGIQPGEERAFGDGVTMKMFRIGATAPLTGGWHLATSTEGGFTVELPLPFNDFRVRAKATDGVEIRSHSIGAKSPGLLAWTATCMARRDGKLGPDERPPAPERTEALGSPIRAWTRTVDWDDRACVLTVEAQGTDPLPPEDDRVRFLRSLRRTGAPGW